MRRRSLPIDVIEDILSKLPVKHLLRCKLVCKSYYAMITSPDFIARHHRSSWRSTGILVSFDGPDNHYYSRERRPPILVPLLPPSPANDKEEEEEESQVYLPPGRTIEDRRYCSFQIVGSCNGLLCSKTAKDDYKSYTVWNPATREYIHLQPHNKMHNTEGFGQNPKSNDYKLVNIYQYWRHDKSKTTWSPAFEVEFWSMNTNCWKVLPPNILSGKVYGLYPRVGLFLRGSLYWLAFSMKKGSDSSTNINDPVVLVSFDMSDNTFRKITLPRGVGHHDHKRDIAVPRFRTVDHDNRGITISDFMGSLSLFVASSRASSSDSHPHQAFFDVWVMDHDKNKWNRRFKSIGPFQRDVQPTSVCVDNGNFLMKYKKPRDNPGNFELIFYDPCCNKEQKRREFPLSDGGYSWRIMIEAWNFTESVVPIKNAKRRRPTRGYRSTNNDDEEQRDC